MPDVRPIDPSECWLRHIVRGEPGVVVAGARFIDALTVAGEDGINGRQGWNQAEVVGTLSDDGKWKVLLPNTTGADGQLHRRRFAILTDPDYEPGEEWVEFWRDANTCMFVGTPSDYRVTSSGVELSGYDLTAVLAGSLSSEIDLWDAAAPADVLHHYTRLTRLVYGADLSGVTLTAVGSEPAIYGQALSGVASDCWVAEARLRVTKPGTGLTYVEVLVEPAVFFQSFALRVHLETGGVTLENPQLPSGERTFTGKVNVSGLGSISLRLVCRYDHVFAFVNGELVAEFRQPPPFITLTKLSVVAYNATVVVDGLHVETLEPFAGRGPSAAIDRPLPGLPPATGLHAQYWPAGNLIDHYASWAARLASVFPVLGEAEPVTDRVEPQLSQAANTFPTGIASSYIARWSGAIYLDLAASDRDVRVAAAWGTAWTRVYVGRTLRGQELIPWTEPSGGEGVIEAKGLRATLGNVAGWYPVVIEQFVDTRVIALGRTQGATLEDRAAGGSFVPVPQTRLSPIGCYTNLIRYTPHRQVFGDVASTFGYQWRVEHRSLESGEFPGQIVAKGLVGRMTDIVIRDDDFGVEPQVAGAALDVVDGLVADAAGLASPTGAQQLSAQVVDYARATQHMALRQGYESLSDISEGPLLHTRLDSLLVLRESPNEQVGVRPSGQRDLVDSMPLTGTLARMDWLPGDAPSLNLEAVDVVDASPRQMTSVAWLLTPDGVGAPTVGFRDRPRTPRVAMKRLYDAIVSPRRNYQGSRAITTGSPGGATFAGAAVAGCADQYSRVPLPSNLATIVKAVACIQQLSGNGWRLEVSGNDLGTEGAVSRPTRVDVTRAIAAAAVGAPLAVCRLVGGSSGSYILTLEVWVAV